MRNHFHDVFMSFLWSNLQTPARSEKPFHGFAADRDDNCAKECKNIIFHNLEILNIEKNGRKKSDPFISLIGGYFQL